MVELFANSADPDQTPHSAASDLALHCLPITLLWVSTGLIFPLFACCEVHASQRILAKRLSVEVG